jgi:hypothetical protein
MMKPRWIGICLGAIVLLLAATVAVSPAADAGAGANKAVYPTLHWLRHKVVGRSIGPSKRTGYGKMTITGLTQVKGHPHRYRIHYRITDHRPTTTVYAPSRPIGVEGAQIAMASTPFCWPWQMFPFSSRACWNEPSTWNWGGIMNHADPLFDGFLSTFRDNLVACYHGAYQGTLVGVFGKTVFGIIFGMADLVKFSPEGAAYTVIAGCMLKIKHPVR